MNDLIARVAAAAGIDEALAGKAIGMILGFMQKEAPGPAGEMLQQMPGATELIAASQGGGGMMGMMGGMMGGGIMGLGAQLMGAGLDMGQMQTVGRELFAHGRETVGEEAMGKVVAAIPGLSQFI
ncbi:MAG: DUF2267 domain-containing protein [Alphaproteobacteria bacterium]